jgi:hypothetical protein
VRRARACRIFAKVKNMQPHNQIKPWHQVNLVQAQWQRSTALWRTNTLPRVWGYPQRHNGVSIVGQWVPSNMGYILTHPPQTLTAPRALRWVVRLAHAFGRNPRNLLLALYYVPNWVPWPLRQLYTQNVALRLYPTGYLYL